MLTNKMFVNDVQTVYEIDIPSSPEEEEELSQEAARPHHSEAFTLTLLCLSPREDEAFKVTTYVYKESKVNCRITMK